MKLPWERRIAGMLLPGLKRWILTILIGVSVIVFGVFLLLGYHPITISGAFVRELLEHAADVLPHRISGILVIIFGALCITYAVSKVTLSVLGAYLPSDREPIPDVLYRRRRLDRGPRVVVIGGGTGLPTLLRGLKAFTNNITAVVTVGDDGGSSGRLRKELGVLPPGDIRNCIAALADEEEIVTDLFKYRFSTGASLEGHSFGNLFLSALCSLTGGDMLQAVKVASRVLNSCGQVLPSTLTSLILVAELEDGRVIKGESLITKAGGSIKRICTEPDSPIPTPEVLEAIKEADLIILGPGSLYTSIIPNLITQGISEAIMQASANKIYVCNVMTQPGETTNYSVADHIRAILEHANCPQPLVNRLIQTVLVNNESPTNMPESDSVPVRYDPEHIRELGVEVLQSSLLSHEDPLHHDPYKLSDTIRFWYYQQGRKKTTKEKNLEIATLQS